MFDLKGSTVGRKTKVEPSRFWRVAMKCDKVLKDINFMEMQADFKRMLVECSHEKKLEILDILRKDSKFLREYGIMDYSLLLAIEDNPEPEFKFSLNNRTT